MPWCVLHEWPGWVKRGGGKVRRDERERGASLVSPFRSSRRSAASVGLMPSGQEVGWEWYHEACNTVDSMKRAWVTKRKEEKINKRVESLSAKSILPSRFASCYARRLWQPLPGSRLSNKGEKKRRKAERWKGQPGFPIRWRKLIGALKLPSISFRIRPGACWVHYIVSLWDMKWVSRKSIPVFFHEE